MVVNFANIDLNERPILILKNAGGSPLGMLGFATNVNVDLKYNEISTIEFDLPAYVDGIKVPFYEDVIGMRVVELKGVGQFVLVNPTEIGNGVKRTKHCKANSLEYEFAYKNITIPNGTYKFWNGRNEDTVMGMILELMPSWSVGTVSAAVQNKYRTLDEVNENVYNFIKGKIQQSFNCIFDFDTVNRRINVRDGDEDPVSEPVYISKDNLAKEIEITENTEDLVTRLDVNGADGVNIRDVNPTGTNKLIDLGYFMTTKNFSQALIDKYTAWKTLCDNSQTDYYRKSLRYDAFVMQKVTEQAKLADLENEMTGLENIQAVTIQAIAEGIQQQSALDAVNANIRAKATEIANKKSEIAAIDNEIETAYRSLTAIRDQCAYDTYFTANEKLELDRYIKDGEVSDSSFVATETGTYDETGAGVALQSTELTITDAVNEAVQDGTNWIYDIHGGVLTIGTAITANVISAVFELRSNGARNFVGTAYLGNGNVNGNAFTNGCLSISASGVNINQTATSLSGYVTGYAYFTRNASDYEQHSIAYELYDYGRSMLDKLAYPSYSFKIDSANFLALSEFESFKNHLQLGQRIYAALRDEGPMEPICIGVKYSYGDKKKLVLEFGDSYASNDSSFRLVDLLNKSVSMGKTVDVSKYTYASFVDSGASTGIREFMNAALDTAKNEIQSSTDQAISWGGAGLRLRKYANQAHTAYDPEQIWLTNNAIVLTDDGWQTAKMAIGKFYDENTGTCWGVVAPMIVGTMIAGESLVIESQKKDGGTAVFRVDGDGCKLYNSDLEVSKTTGSTTTQIVVNPDIGIAIGTSPLYTVDDEGVKTLNPDNAKFYADNNGNLHVEGAINATSLSIENKPASQYVDDAVTAIVEDGVPKVVNTSLTVDTNGINMTGGTINMQAGTGIDIKSGGTFTVSGGNFSIDNQGNVTMSGRITASTGSNIGGWTIATNDLHSGSGSTYVSLNSAPTATNAYTFWAGSETAAQAPFSVKKDGEMKATSGTIGGWTLAASDLHAGSGSSYVALNSAPSASNPYAIWAGSATAANAPFSVTDTGVIKAASGTVGGWNLGANALYSGSGTSYVALSSDTSSTYAMWAGNATAANAPFRVGRDGSVYLSKLYTVDEQGDPQQVNLAQYPLWKLNYRTVKSFTKSESGNIITLTIGTSGGDLSVNFSRASSPTIAELVAMNSQYVDRNRTSVTLRALDENDQTLFEQEGVYILTKDAYDEGAGSVTVDTVEGVGTPLWYPSLTSYVVPIRGVASNGAVRQGTANVDATAAVNYGQDSVTINKGSWSSGSISFTKSTGAASTKSVVLVAGNPSTTGGVTTVPVTDNGTSTGFFVRVTQKTVSGLGSITLAATDTGTSTKSTAVTYSDSSTGSANISINAANVYAAGKAAITWSDSGWSSGARTISMKDGTTSLASASISLSGGTASTPSTGTTTTVPIMDGSTNTGKSITVAQRSVSALSKITLGATATGTSSQSTTVTYTAGSTGTATVSVDASAVYSAGDSAGYTRGRNSVTLSYGDWASGKCPVTATNGQSVSVPLPSNFTITGGASFTNHKTTVGVSGGGATGLATKEIDATSEYNSGWNDCRSAATNLTVVYNATSMSRTTLYEKLDANTYVAAGTGQWWLGGYSRTAYLLPDPK